MTVRMTLLEAGHCVHPEHVVHRNLRLTSLRFPALFALLEHPTRGPWLFDTGYAERFLDATRRWPERLYRCVTPVTLPERRAAALQLRALGVEARDVEAVVVSHFHADHVAGLLDFPRARVVCLREAWDAARGLGGLAALRRGLLPALFPHDLERRIAPVERAPFVDLPPELAPFRRGADLAGDGSLLAVPLPGHARGQVGLFVRHDRGTTLLCADAAWTSRAVREERMPSAVTRLLFDDWGGYRATLGELHRLARSGVDVVPSHCEEAAARLVGRDGGTPT